MKVMRRSGNRTKNQTIQKQKSGKASLQLSDQNLQEALIQGKAM